MIFSGFCRKLSFISCIYLHFLTKLNFSWLKQELTLFYPCHNINNNNNNNNLYQKEWPHLSEIWWLLEDIRKCPEYAWSVSERKVGCVWKMYGLCEEYLEGL